MSEINNRNQDIRKVIIGRDFVDVVFKRRGFYQSEWSISVDYTDSKNQAQNDL